MFFFTRNNKVSFVFSLVDHLRKTIATIRNKLGVEWAFKSDYFNFDTE